MKKNTFVYKFSFLAVMILIAATGCHRETLVQYVPREDLFTISYGKFEDQLIFDNMEYLGEVKPATLYMQDGFFYILSSVSKKVMQFNSYGDLLGIYYNPDTNPAPVFLGEDNNSSPDAGSEEVGYSYKGTEINRLSLFDANFIFLEAERWGPRSTYNKTEVRAYNTALGIQGELTPAYLNNALATNEEIGIKEMRHDSLQEGQLQLTENVNAWMAQIMHVPSLKANVTEVNKDQVKLEYGMAGTKGKKYSALQAGFGFTYCLPVIVALLRAKKGDLLIFENPEAHLHPSAQVELGKLMALVAGKGVQVIIESHSDHILNSLRLARKEQLIPQEKVNVIFVQRCFGTGGDMDVTYTTEIQITDSGKLTERPSFFFDSWDDVLTRLLY